MDSREHKTFALFASSHFRVKFKFAPKLFVCTKWLCATDVVTAKTRLRKHCCVDRIWPSLKFYFFWKEQQIHDASKINLCFTINNVLWTQKIRNFFFCLQNKGSAQISQQATTIWSSDVSKSSLLCSANNVLRNIPVGAWCCKNMVWL